VDILGTVLLRFSSGKILPIFIEIGSYLTDREQKISWHSFLRHSVENALVWRKPPPVARNANDIFSIDIFREHLSPY